MRINRLRNRRAIRLPALQNLEDRTLFSVILVDQNAPGPTHDGNSWQTAYNRLQVAITNAIAGDVIEVADGTYTPTNGTNRNATFTLKSHVEIDGGFEGFGGTNPDGRDIVANPTILSGNIGDINNDADNSRHVVTGKGVNSTAILDGVTVRDGFAHGPGSDDSSGAGIDNIHGSPTIRNCTISFDNADFYGGIANLNNSSPTISDCLFIQDTASINGGAMGNVDSSPTIANCTFQANGCGADGCAIFSQDSTTTINNCQFLGNVGSTSGGGAISNRGGTMNLTNCLLVRNWSYGVGGGIEQEGGTANIDNCTLRQNGWIQNGTPHPLLEGGAIYSHAATINLTNSILWGNVAQTGPQIRQTFGSNVSVKYTDYQGGHAGAGNISTRPRFISKPNPGPDGDWDTLDDNFGNQRLKNDSPAIDAGRNVLVPAGITTDLDGNSRFIDDPGVNDPGAIVDMGAYEFQVAKANSPGTTPSTGDIVTGSASPDSGAAFSQSLLEDDGDGDLPLLA